MTLIAGFVARDGLLLCSDSQYTVPYGCKEPGQKIFTRAIEQDARLTFAFCGDNDYAKSAIEDCYHEALALKPEARTIQKIRETIKTTIYRSVERCERDRPELIVAISARGEKAELFLARDAAVAPIELFEFRGGGSDIGQVVYRSFSLESHPTIERLIPACLYSFSVASRHHADVGFGTQILCGPGYAYKRNCAGPHGRSRA